MDNEAIFRPILRRDTSVTGCDFDFHLKTLFSSRSGNEAKCGAEYCLNTLRLPLPTYYVRIESRAKKINLDNIKDIGLKVEKKVL